MKKKMISLVLGTCFLSLILWGCAGTNTTETSQNAASSQNSQQALQITETPDDLAEEVITQVPSQAPAQTPEQTPAQTKEVSSQQETQTVQASQALTQEDAKNLALQKAGITESDTIGLTVKMDHDDGIQKYEVDIYTPQTDYEYEINAADASFIKEEIKSADQVSQIVSDSAITPEDAKNLALGKVPGASEQNIRMKLEHDDGHSIYEGEIIYNNASYEYEIDAQTGDIIEWSQEAL